MGDRGAGHAGRDLSRTRSAQVGMAPSVRSDRSLESPSDGAIAKPRPGLSNGESGGPHRVCCPLHGDPGPPGPVSAA